MNEEKKIDDEKNNEKEKEKEKDISNFECIICMGIAKEPVVTKCGHLYCWPCIYAVIYYFNTKKVARSEKRPNRLSSM